MKTHQYSFVTIEKHIRDQLIETHNDYKYMTDFVWPLVRQESLHKSFPAILDILQRTTEDSFVIGLSKLIDSTKDPLVIHFKKFINEANKIIPGKIINKNKWGDFCKEGGLFLKDIPKLKRKLDYHRNKFRTHIMPAKPVSTDNTTWLFWKETLARMEKIYNLYQLAVKSSYNHQFYVADLDHEPEAFMKWCRLDEFEKHREIELRIKHKKIS